MSEKSITDVMEAWNGDIDKMPSELATWVENNRDNLFIDLALISHKANKKQIASIKAMIAESDNE